MYIIHCYFVAYTVLLDSLLHLNYIISDFCISILRESYKPKYINDIHNHLNKKYNTKKRRTQVHLF